MSVFGLDRFLDQLVRGIASNISRLAIDGNNRTGGGDVLFILLPGP